MRNEQTVHRHDYKIENIAALVEHSVHIRAYNVYCIHYIKLVINYDKIVIVELINWLSREIKNIVKF